MHQPIARLRRFAIAYVAAAFAAAAAMLIVQYILIFWIERDFEALAYVHEVALVYLVYSLGFTLCLGLVGWGMLTVLRQSSLRAFMVLGGGLGLLTGALSVTNGLTPANG